MEDEQQEHQLLACPNCQNQTFKCLRYPEFISINCIACNTQVGKINTAKPTPEQEEKNEDPTRTE